VTRKTDFLRETYDQLHATPMQQKLRKIAPMPVGVVFIEWPGMTEDDMRRHFRLMKELGYTCLKGILLCRGTDRRKVMHMALDEGIIPWWYDEGGWEAITDELLESLGIDPATPVEQIRTNETFLAHQEKVLRERIDREADEGSGRPVERGFRNVFRFDGSLPDEMVDDFLDWLVEQYETVDGVWEAWNMHHAGIPGPAEPWTDWPQVRAYVQKAVDGAKAGQASLYVPMQREYRRIRDILRFKADQYVAYIRRRIEAQQQADPNAVFRAGGEMGLFLPFASRATDMEGIASVMAEGGSFYPSIHLAWHFEEVGFEVARPVYFQASLVADWFKGGWSATWESTGGPQQLSGGKANLYPPAQNVWPSSTVDAGVMTQLMLSYLAAGFRGFGFWTWTARTAGWEAGEFALLDRNAEPCRRTVQAGKVAQAARRWRDELWEARKEPVVGVFTDFDNDAMWSAASVAGRDFYKRVPVFARVGASRALVNGNVPFEHVTARDLRAGLAPRYQVIYLPAVLALAGDLQEVLLDYARQGGRVVLDMPGAWYDDFGRMLSTAKGTPFEKLFGASIRDYQYSRNVPRSLNGRQLDGFVVDLGVTGARTLAEYDSGGPAITEHAVGDGAGVILGWEASLQCHEPGNDLGEAELRKYALGSIELPYACDGALVYRQAAPEADHYFLINDGPETTVTLKTPAYRYASALDVIADEPIAPGDPIDLPAHSGRWVRMAR
jgi:beta-galactosidase